MKIKDEASFDYDQQLMGADMKPFVRWKEGYERCEFRKVYKPQLASLVLLNLWLSIEQHDPNNNGNFPINFVVKILIYAMKIERRGTKSNH